MSGKRHLINILLISSLLTTTSAAIALDQEKSAAPQVGVGAQYDTTHVYVAPEDVDKFAASFLSTFGGQSTKQVVATVTPTSSSTTSQLLQTPVGTVSLFGFILSFPGNYIAEIHARQTNKVTPAPHLKIISWHSTVAPCRRRFRHGCWLPSRVMPNSAMRKDARPAASIADP